ncbi:MAG: type III-A CRISPR-associated protein Cas10/Csm1 [Syntrophorhabdaceae bacterium]|nr:type III-A CRISPR-associated protein Cas10/Csm1 [Syntrophorhabdaceae bacterium]MDD5242898.1 type III-A CRISPR-associated protein Cas10/Csm1 [Syntrophorhabdaceae bacterium]
MEPNRKEYQAVILGALLHDIGKFVQRAQKNPKLKDHASWGGEWFQEHLSERLSPLFDEKEKETVRSAIGGHHGHEKYITLADGLSAGSDRIELEREEKGDPFTDSLISIFSEVSISPTKKKPMYHSITRFDTETIGSTFPVAESGCRPEDYARLLKLFEAEIARMDFGTVESVTEMLNFLLWKYCWCIPSAAYKSEPDVSLFDHLKTTAAIAACLYLYEHETGKPANTGTEAFLLTGGDISGIQHYIFDVLNQQGKVAKRLRARSLLVQLVSEIASHKLLHSFDLPPCNTISAAGGNFYILAPNTDRIRNSIESLQKEFDLWTVNHMNAELSVHLASTVTSGKGLGDFARITDLLRTELSYRKHRPHSTVLVASGRWMTDAFVRPEIIEGAGKACSGCHRKPVLEGNDSEDGLCERCAGDVRMGRLLPRCEYIAFHSDGSGEFGVFDYSFDLRERAEARGTEERKPYAVLRLNSTDIEPPATGFKLFATRIPTGADIPESHTEENAPVTFDGIAGASRGYRYLGYVRSDVDNMGKILREGFSARMSVSRFSTFSRMVETFFSGYLQVKLARDFRKIYAVFSGGDDCLVLGPWNDALEFIRETRAKFTAYCAGNPDLSFSAGHFMSGPHEPLSYCAAEVNQELERSKQAGKNRITLFGTTVSWEELDTVLAEASRVIGWTTTVPPVISRSLIQNLRAYGEMAEKSGIFRPESAGIDTGYLRFVPLLARDTARNLTRKDQQEALDWTVRLRPTVETPAGGVNLPFLKIIMEYVLTYTRSRL